MISSGVSADEKRSTFTVFEPCHDGDAYSKQVMDKGCEHVIRTVTRCNFEGIFKLWGLADPHSTHHVNGSALTTEAAGEVCSSADIVAFKTVDTGHMIRDWEWLLDETPNMRVLNVIRDPRGIYASWKTLEPFKTLLEKDEFYTLDQVCENFVANLEFDHPRVLNVVFEDMVLRPGDIMQQVYGFLGLPFGDSQVAWIESTFDAIDCPEPKPWEVGYTDCHTNSQNSADKWRTVLSEDELDNFNDSPACQRVVAHFAYPKS
jgi:hypothetical protein